MLLRFLFFDSIPFVYFLFLSILHPFLASWQKKNALRRRFSILGPRKCELPAPLTPLWKAHFKLFASLSVRALEHQLKLKLIFFWKSILLSLAFCQFCFVLCVCASYCYSISWKGYLSGVVSKSGGAFFALLLLSHCKVFVREVLHLTEQHFITIQSGVRMLSPVAGT